MKNMQIESPATFRGDHVYIISNLADVKRTKMTKPVLAFKTDFVPVFLFGMFPEK